MSGTGTSLVGILRRQFDPSFCMLAGIVEACPDALWAAPAAGNPFWQVIMHALIGIQFWFREAQETFVVPDFGQGPVPDLDAVPTFSMTKQDVRDYQATMAVRVAKFFGSLNDDRLTTPSSFYDKCTYMDLVLGQIRHIQHHVGACNSILRQNHAAAVRWQGYAE